MDIKLQRIAVMTNYNIPEKAGAALSVVEELLRYGVEILIPQINRGRVEKLKKPGMNPTYLPMDEVYANADLVVTLGGDGTILEVARRTAFRNTPILGLNLGRLGFMAELELEKLDRLEGLFNGSAWLETRSMLKADVLEKGDPDNVKVSSFALNDAVIQNGGAARIVNLELFERGVPVSTYRGDGLIVSTPTGSTAYSLSAGGPVIDPKLNCLCITPICPHSLNMRPILFPDDAIIEIKSIEDRARYLCLTLDGRINVEIHYGDIVRITKSPMKTTLVRLDEQSFYNRLRQKMSST